MGTWIAGAVVLGVVTLAARKVYKDRKSGKSCGCDSCAGCPGCSEANRRQSV